MKCGLHNYIRRFSGVNREMVSIFKKKLKTESYDKSLLSPVLRCSICTGETVAGFKDKTTGKFTEDMLIQNENDLQAFKKKYNIEHDIEKIY